MSLLERVKLKCCVCTDDRRGKNTVPQLPSKCVVMLARSRPSPRVIMAGTVTGSWALQVHTTRDTGQLMTYTGGRHGTCCCCEEQHDADRGNKHLGPRHHTQQPTIMAEPRQDLLLCPYFFFMLLFYYYFSFSSEHLAFICACCLMKNKFKCHVFRYSITSAENLFHSKVHLTPDE